MLQTALFPDLPEARPCPVKQRQNSRSGTFTDNMRLPVHRWFRYSAGFSAAWAETVIAQYPGAVVCDPFAGSGTTLLAAQAQGARGIGFESHPFVYRIARAKLAWDVDTALLRAAAAEVLDSARDLLDRIELPQVPLLQKCYTDDNLRRLEALKQAYLQRNGEGPIWELIWLALTGIVRMCSTAGTAQWQYVLPNKPKASVVEAFQAFREKTRQMITDILDVQDQGWGKRADLYLADARKPDVAVSENSVDLVLTSPPYPNNYDYADATRLEMSFWGEINGWGQLQDKVRRYLVRSCSQHSAAEKLQLDDVLQQAVLAPIRDELAVSCAHLAEIRLSKGGKKTYHTMAAAYFLDLAEVFLSLRHLCKDGATLCLIIGDSAPYGVHLPVDEWLGRLALAAGFKSFRFEKLRDRNVKWKNRKHSVPLHEGRLWIEG